MKPLAAILVATLAVAVVAFIADSGILLLISVVLLAGFTVGVFAGEMRTAQEGDFVLPYLLILGGALGIAAVGVMAIVLGERGDAPGLVLLGVAVIVSAIVVAFALGVRTARTTR